MQEFEDLMPLMQMRQGAYALLARVFSDEPEQGMISALCSDDFAQACDLLCDGRQLWESMREASRAASIEELKSAYTALLIGPDKLPAAPWESVNVGQEPLLFTKDTLAVREAYRSQHFESVGYPHVPDDHIATELSFMAATCGRAADALSVGDKQAFEEALRAQQGFLGNHLGRWVATFAHDVAEARIPHAAFYIHAAALAARLCENDASALEELLSSS